MSWLALRRLPRGWTCQVAAAGRTSRPPRALTRLRQPREACLRNCQVRFPVHITPSFQHLAGPYSHISYLSPELQSIQRACARAADTCVSI